MSLEVLAATGLVTVQDAGRPGFAHLGVPRAGWLDAPAALLANRLVGNAGGEAVLEVLGALALRADRPLWVAVTGARSPVSVDGRAAAFGEPVHLAHGAVLRVDLPASGLRAYLAVAGGIGVERVLGSRSTDTLAWVGPPRVTGGAVLPVGPATGEPHPLDTPRAPAVTALRLLPGPRADWFECDPVDHLVNAPWTVAVDSNRAGLRLEGPALRRHAAYEGSELASEGMVLGAVQVPPSGQPVVFLADHPVTGGYPVAAVAHPDDLWICAQVRPGERVRFRRG
jgi:biotin-dependent carboxylase-like uncharacterized protein